MRKRASVSTRRRVLPLPRKERSTSPTTFKLGKSTPSPLLLLRRKCAQCLFVANRIQNPLHGISRAKLVKHVEQFAKEQGLEDKVELFTKGALIAQNPGDFESMPELSEEEKEVIRRETTRELLRYFRLHS